MPEIVHLPPRGRYLAQEVGQLAGISGQTIGQWSNYGYIRASQSEPGEYPKVYSYQDVAEAMVVHELLDKKVPLSVLRPVVDGLQHRFGDWPCSTPAWRQSPPRTSPSPLYWSAKAIIASRLATRGWQVVAHTTVNPRRVVTDLHRGGWAVRKIPDLRYIEVDPDLLSGRPAIKGRRVPVSLVAELAATLDGNEALREEFELSDDEINDAVRWWEATTSFDQVAA